MCHMPKCFTNIVTLSLIGCTMCLKFDDYMSDPIMMLAIGHSIAHCYKKLKNMMEQPEGGFNRSLTHNLVFKLSKTSMMNFPRSFRDLIPGGLSLDRTNPNGSVTSSLT